MKLNPSGVKKYPPKQPGTTIGRTTTHEGGFAFTRDMWSELIMFAVSNMVGEDTFYEKASDRDERFERLIRACAMQSGEEMFLFLQWLRGEANMRSASIVGAVEAVRARLDALAASVEAPSPAESGWNRKMIDVVCQRPDEPTQLLAYYASRYGAQEERAVNGIAPSPRLPICVKRGLGDAVRRQYTERSLLKYDSAGGAVRFGDVIDQVHPSPDPEKPWQGDLFEFALDRRHNRDKPIQPRLGLLRRHAELMAVPVAQRRAILREPDAAEVLRQAGMTWESLAGWLQGPMDKLAWEAIIPSMGAMALARNIRNFDEAGVSDEVAQAICVRLADAEEIARSRQFPYRYLSAYRAAPSLRWGHGLEQALSLATANIPLLDGRTLVLVDTSASMANRVSAKSAVRRVDVGALFGVALAARGANVDLVGFATGTFLHPLKKGGSVLRQTEEFCRRVGEVAHGTEIAGSLRARYAGHDRVVVISDEQTFSRYDNPSEAIPANIPLFGVNLGGYKATVIDTSKPNRYSIGGFSDKLFTMVDLLSRGKDANWPWRK